MFLRHVSYRFIAAIGLILPATNAFSQQPDYRSLFNQTEQLSLEDEPDATLSRKVLQGYDQVISFLAKSKKDPGLMLRACVNAGAYLQVLGQEKNAATYFRKAFALRAAMPAIPDSAIYKPLVYCGNSYYRLDRLDSAAYFYDRAKTIAEKYAQLAEIERLYNTLGVMAYASGNYSKSIIYYEKALAVLNSHKQIDQALLVPYKSNLASAYRRLKRYSEALALYKSILSYHIESDKINHNIGSLYLAMGNTKEALNYLNKVGYQDIRKLNDQGNAYLLQSDTAKALDYLKKATELHKKTNGRHKSSDYGITLKYLGDLYLRQNQFVKSLNYYQQAIQNLLVDFNSADIYTNPNNFNTVFNITELLGVLQAKAEAFDKMYRYNRQVKTLQASLDTYLAFYKLTGHIERFYESDEARLEIGERKYAARLRPITICLELYKLTGNETFIRKAFFLDEENKANTLFLALNEASLRLNSHVPAALLKTETELKQAITRASLRAAQETDSTAITRFKREVNDLSLKLIAVQQKINHAIGAGQFTTPEQEVNLKALQSIIPSSAALLSYHIGEKELLCFIITKDDFDFVTVPLAGDYQTLIKNYYENAQARGRNNSALLQADGKKLYGKLIGQVKGFIAGKKSLMIIPDGLLNYLPFEVLPDESGEPLLNQYSISYNYSCAILQRSKPTSTVQNASRLSMAPFTEELRTIKQECQLPARLRASAAEVEAVGGTVFTGHLATKKRFLELAGKYNIIHLATHATANDADIKQSYISFYPEKPDSALNYKLFEPEIYNLKLDKTNLVVLSACESGAGQFVKGEGIMSLSRAFSYAGCANIIPSMWKADDAATAYLSAKMDHYIAEGFTLSRALQQAKIDYLDDDAISPAKKQPGYWANMRLIGNFQESPAGLNWLYIAGSGLVILGLLLFISKKRGSI
ncbi:CHAT domain-containing protein [Mucilaginibacter psychrotolerans]|uniref:CHAT domain-containing protein n=1 Tax=Mucilaginibacter psychrotolerans TaxID=1524096 RepID=A0A4Y8SBR9_9SPHI|nr:CHAT domain-containing protein [Mucilaginibacter psychrotolerans]TFF36111.1 CHAT domain-containing protein [Mucilaginibacter psychrotolerans]